MLVQFDVHIRDAVGRLVSFKQKYASIFAMKQVDIIYLVSPKNVI